MPSTYKTPGVYIKEINAFPPTVMQVKTAVPVFIGYTATSPENAQGLPVKIYSMKDFDNKFGGPPKPETITISSLNPLKATVAESKYKLYTSMDLFFANGGSECYVISIAKYEDVLSDEVDSFKAALDEASKIDEITLISLADCMHMSADDVAEVQAAALKQCSDLKDRFAILDVKEINETASLDSKLVQSMDSFRNKIGMVGLEFGAAYYPDLKVKTRQNYRLSDIGFDVFKSYYSGTTLADSVEEYEVLFDELKVIYNNYNSNSTFGFNVDSNEVDNKTNLAAYYENFWDLLGVLANPATSITDPILASQVSNQISLSLVPQVQKLADFKSSYELIYTDNADKLESVFGNPDHFAHPNPWPTMTATAQYDNVIKDSSVPSKVDFNEAKKILDSIYTSIKESMDSILNQMKEYESSVESTVISSLPLYQDIAKVLSEQLSIVPPSGAIAGIYAGVDRNRGVHYAPANVSISGIVGLNDRINDTLQADMNVNEFGKSIVALREISGRGLIVYGDRTLKSHIPDSRYINIMRLKIMLEESIKKAAGSFVFEPNVKQTWIKVQTMIEAYMTGLWRDGALTGSKPEDAFYVRVGLDDTMSGDDIRDGYMRVTVGFAPPFTVEFIEISFTLKEQSL